MLLLASVASQTLADDPSTETVALFNGHDLDGLHIYVNDNSTSPSEAWTIEDSMLRCTGIGRGYARTTSAFADYRLHLEWRWPNGPGNSGVMLNLVGQDMLWPKSFESQLASGRAGDMFSFVDARNNEEIVSRNPNGVSTGRLLQKEPSAENPVGEWNSYDILVEGDTITLSINGKQVNRMTGTRPSAGMIGLQAEGTAIDFRNITLTPLPPAKDLYAPMPE
jgi:hypothetical protein